MGRTERAEAILHLREEHKKMQWQYRETMRKYEESTVRLKLNELAFYQGIESLRNLLRE